MSDSMKYAICNEMYGDWPFAKACSHAFSLGYTGLEIAPFTLSDSPTSLPQSRRQEIRAIVADSGMEVVGLHWLLAQTEGLHLTAANAGTRQKTTDYLKGLAELCFDLGGSVMVFGSPQQRNVADGLSQKDANRYAIEVIQNAASMFAKCDVTLALEPLGPEEGNFLLTAESAIALANQIDRPNVKLHLDVKAMTTESTPVPEIIRASKDWTVHFHANDPNRLGPGMGDVDFGPIFEALHETHYQGWVSVEAFDYSLGIDALASDSIRYMRQFENEH